MGVKSVSSTDVSMIGDAVALAKSADVTVLVVGTDLSLAHEGHDATNLTLSPVSATLFVGVDIAFVGVDISIFHLERYYEGACHCAA
jgi:hypothetical protein